MQSAAVNYNKPMRMLFAIYISTSSVPRPRVWRSARNIILAYASEKHSTAPFVECPLVSIFGGFWITNATQSALQRVSRGHSSLVVSYPAVKCLQRLLILSRTSHAD